MQSYIRARLSVLVDSADSYGLPLPFYAHRDKCQQALADVVERN